ncbi:MAG TPA: OsmC family protein [Planctomycetota bacterium]|nr:OsmC family protein [Planctomycetota bacterium]
MVEIRMQYEGGLRCRAVHGPSGAELVTDAPTDNHGQGASFSPTDLVATALGTCVLTTMGIVAERHGWALAGSSARVVKVMVSEPTRRIGRLELVVTLPAALDERARTTLERTAHPCPVHRSLGEGVELPMRFEYTLGATG